MSEQPIDPRGLCPNCTHVQLIPHPRGGAPYLRCGMSDVDKRFPKFPPQPVRECCGYEPRDAKV
jgi:hypothetical protein